MCKTLFAMIELQDVSRDVVISRASSIASLLSDVSQISDNALVSCSAALTKTVIENARYLSTDNDAIVISNSLSNVLAVGSRLVDYPEILSAVSQSIHALSVATQSAMVVGEAMKEITTSNCRIGTQKVDSNNASTLTVPQPVEEVFNNKPATLVDIESTNTDGSIGVSLVQYSKNPKALLETNFVSTSTGIGISLMSYSSNGKRRRLSSGTVKTVITLRNTQKVQYSNFTSEFGVVKCKETKGTGSYIETAACSKSGETFSFICPDMSKGGVYEFSCPTKYDEPVCTFWDEHSSKYAVNPNCKVISATSDTTLCSCTMESQSQNRRKLPHETIKPVSAVSPEDWLVHASHRVLQQAEVMEFTSSIKSVADNFGKTFSSLGVLVIDDVMHNQTVLITLSTVLGTLIIGIILFAWLDAKEHKVLAIKGWKKKPKIAYTVNDFFNTVIPEEFSGYYNYYYN